MSALVAMKGVTKFYGRNMVLNGIDLEIQPGQIVGLLGPNGCGKTTMLKILSGAITDYKGAVTIGGHPVSPESKAIVSYLPDKMPLDESMRAGDAIAFYKDFFADFDVAKAAELMDRFGLDRKQMIKSMSKGMQEKVQLILVVSRQAKIYLLDEPLGGIDPAARETMLNIILQNYSTDAAVILSTHLIYDVERIFERVLMLKNGQFLIDSDVDTLRTKQGKSVLDVFKEVFAC